MPFQYFVAPDGTSLWDILRRRRSAAFFQGVDDVLYPTPTTLMRSSSAFTGMHTNAAPVQQPPGTETPDAAAAGMITRAVPLRLPPASRVDVCAAGMRMVGVPVKQPPSMEASGLAVAVRAASPSVISCGEEQQANRTVSEAAGMVGRKILVKRPPEQSSAGIRSLRTLGTTDRRGGKKPPPPLPVPGQGHKCSGITGGRTSGKTSSTPAGADGMATASWPADGPDSSPSGGLVPAAPPPKRRPQAAPPRASGAPSAPPTGIAGSPAVYRMEAGAVGSAPYSCWPSQSRSYEEFEC